MFEHYVFLANGEAGEHLPPAMRGVLASADRAAIAELKRHLINNLLGRSPEKAGPFA